MKDMNIYTTNIKCRNCGKVHPFTMYTLIDPIKQKDAEMKLLSTDYFQDVCPQCHYVQPIAYSCMYHDGERKILIAFADADNDYVRMKTLLTEKQHHTKLDQALNEWLKTCDVRLVRSVYALQEKVLLVHYNYDDRMIEILKYKLLKELRKDRNDIHELLFNTKDDEFIFLHATDAGIVGQTVMQMEMYDAIVEQYEQAVIYSNDIEINQEWAKKIVEA